VRIAVIHPSMLPKGGAERVVMWLCAALQERGHAVTLITSDYDEYWGSREALGFPVVEFGVHGIEWRRNTIQDWHDAADRLRPLLAGFDVVNPHNYPAYVWAQWAREGLPEAERPPIVWFCEEPYRAFYGKLTDTHCAEADRLRAVDPIFVQARAEARVVATSSPPHKRLIERAKRILRPFDINALFQQAEAIDRETVPKLDLILGNSGFIASNVTKVFSVPARPCHLGIPIEDIGPEDVERRPFLLAVTRLHPAKNVDGCLRAVAALRDRGSLPFERFVIVGDGPERAYLEAVSRLLAIDDVVDFRGFASDAEVRELYRTAAAVIYVPLDETFGLPFLEAAEFRKAVVGPSVGGPAELVVDGVTGLVVDPLDSRAIADAVARLFTDPELARTLGEAGHARLLEHFTFEKFVDRFEGELGTLSGIGAEAPTARGSLCTVDRDRETITEPREGHR